MLFDLFDKRGSQPDISDSCQVDAEPCPNLPNESLSITIEECPTVMPSASIDASPTVVSIEASPTAMPSFSPKGSLAESLMAAKQSARSRQLRLRVPTVLGGICCAVPAFGFRSVSGAAWPAAIANCFAVSGGVLGLLALLPSDKRAVPLFCKCFLIPTFLFYCILSVVGILKNFSMLRDESCALYTEDVPCSFLYVDIVRNGLVMIDYLVGIARFMLALWAGVSSRALLSTMWLAGGWAFLGVGVGYVITGLIGFPAGLESSISIGLISLGVPFVVAAPLMLVKSSFRSTIQSWFISRGESAVTAAGVAALLGVQNIDELLVAARSSFNYVRADRVTYTDMENNRPDPTLARLTERGHLGFVDAFVSHSWHDDPDKKWKALQNLRGKFKSRKSREPKLWIDKYSIDQQNIEMSLAALPVYISGCTELWILCGPTYLERLWCIVEIYVFIEMGGLRSNLHVELLEDYAKMCDHHAHFDPRKARCFTDADTERLLDVIETTGHEQICFLVRDVFFRTVRTTPTPKGRFSKKGA